MEAAIAEAIDEARAFGTALVGDISNTLATSIAAGRARACRRSCFTSSSAFSRRGREHASTRPCKRCAKLPAADDVRHSLAPHAPYSVSPALFAAHPHGAERRIRLRGRAFTSASRRPKSSFCATARALARAPRRTRHLGSGVGAPECGPVEYVDRMGFLDDRLLVVHGVQFGADELERMAAKGATLVTCPRGNIRTGAGAPPIADFFESGVRVAVGTDSLASVPDLNMFAELAEMRRLAPERAGARRCSKSATINGARALGFEPISARSSRQARLARSPSKLDGRVRDVEEYLVSGIEPAQIRWLSRVMTRACRSTAALTSVLVKHARDAFVSESVIAGAVEGAEFFRASRFRAGHGRVRRVPRDPRAAGAEILFLPRDDAADPRFHLHARRVDRRAPTASILCSMGKDCASGRAAPSQDRAVEAGLADRRSRLRPRAARRRRSHLARRADGRGRPGRPHQRRRHRPAASAPGRSRRGDRRRAASGLARASTMSCT